MLQTLNILQYVYSLCGCRYSFYITSVSILRRLYFCTGSYVVRISSYVSYASHLHGELLKELPQNNQNENLHEWSRTYHFFLTLLQRCACIERRVDRTFINNSYKPPPNRGYPVVKTDSSRLVDNILDQEFSSRVVQNLPAYPHEESCFARTLLRTST